LKSHRSAIYFIIEVVANNVINADHSVGFNTVMEELPNLLPLSIKPKMQVSEGA
jgi:hypothetical protein